MAEWFATIGFIWIIMFFVVVIIWGIVAYIINENIYNKQTPWQLLLGIIMIMLFIVPSIIWQNWYMGTISYERALKEHQSKITGLNRIVEVYDRDCNILLETYEGNIYVNYEGNYVEIHLENERVLLNNACVITREK